MTIREGKWKCTYCDEINLGRDLKCTGCGATREQDVQFIYEENAAEVTDDATLQQAKAGPEWVCETCGVSNPSTRSDCRQCAAPRGSSRARDVRMVLPPMPSPAPAPAPKGSALKTLGVIAVSFIALIAITIFYFTRSSEAELAVTGVEWQRNIDVEEFRTVTEQKWEDEVPSGARVVSRAREFHHNEKVQTGTRSVEQSYTERVQVGTKKVKVGTKDLGNGYFEDVFENKPVYEEKKRTKTVQEPVYRDEPIYKNKVTYQVDRWVKLRTEQARGNDNSPRWPKVAEGPKLRAGSRAEKYTVDLKDNNKGKTYQQEVAEAEFSRLKPGTVCKAVINNLGTIKKLEPK